MIRFRWSLLAAVLAACSSSTEPGATGASIRFVGAVNVTDTIGAVIPQTLVVEVHDSTGALAPQGTLVRFTAVVTNSKADAYVQPLTSTSYNLFATGTTDQAGRTGVFVKLGTHAGTARIVVNVPTLALDDTARFVVTPGNAVAALVSPADTVLYVGKSFTLRGGVVDAWNNARTDPVTWSSTASGLTVTSDGVVTATAIGRYAVTATGSRGTATGAVSVVPQGKLVAADGFYVTRGLHVFDVDGSNDVTVATVTDPGIGPHPRWIPGTSTVVYTTLVGGYLTLYAVGADGVAKPFFATAPPNVTHQAEPTPSADGKWMYFSAIDTRCSPTEYCLSRAKIDGSEPELLLPVPARSPAPSPDGSKVAYVDNPYVEHVGVLDVATKTLSLSVVGNSPAWSPDGTQIAYLDGDGALSFVAPDGTGSRTFSPMVYAQGPLSWSSDGKWVVALSSGGVALIDATNGTVLRLPYASDRFMASLR